jgi:dTDP-4-dehydrorhamnose reductase
MEKLLITGADSLVGSNLALAFKDRYQVFGLVSNDHIALDGCRTIPCDLSSAQEIAFRVQEHSPNLIIHCGPLSVSSWDFDPTQAIDGAQQSQIAAAIVAAAEPLHSRVAVISTDAVFAGPHLFHTEACPAKAAGALAEAARLLERTLAGSSALIIRTHAYGWNAMSESGSFAENVWHALSEGRCATVDATRYATPILASDLAELLQQALRAGLQGVCHLAGAERTNQYRFAAELAVACGFTGRQVLLAPPEGVATRPIVDETSLNTRLVRRVLESPLPMLREGLARFSRQAPEASACPAASEWLSPAVEVAAQLHGHAA